MHLLSCIVCARDGEFIFVSLGKEHALLPGKL